MSQERDYIRAEKVVKPPTRRYDTDLLEHEAMYSGPPHVSAWNIPLALFDSQPPPITSKEIDREVIGAFEKGLTAIK